MTTATLLAALGVALLFCQASAAGRLNLDMSHHARASLRRLQAAGDVNSVDKCTYKQDFSLGKVGACIPNQLYLMSVVKFGTEYNQVDR